jgi:cytochrome c oxidase subunit 3
MSTASAAIAAPLAARLDRGKVGMICFLCTEGAFFSTLIVAYITYIGKTTNGPTPAESLSLPLALANTFFLVTSSWTMARAARGLQRGVASEFHRWLYLTIALGAAFLVTTGVEWTHLIVDEGLTLGRNLFGTTYFTLLGFHAAHVTIGLSAMLVLRATARRIRPSERAAGLAELLAWYWHFVDGVWIVILMVVYVVGR